MNILFICDYYPPYEKGGYEQLCKDVAQGLVNRGNQVAVLCVDAGKESEQQTPEKIYRELRIPVSFDDNTPIPLQQFFKMPFRKHHNEGSFHKAVRESSPDVIVFWPNLYGDCHLMRQAEKMDNVLTAYYVAGVSPWRTNLGIYWNTPGRLFKSRILKKFLTPFLSRPADNPTQIQANYIMCVSEYEKNRMVYEGVNSDRVVVVHNGIDVDQYSICKSQKEEGQALNILYMGRLVEEKGVHILIEAVNQLVQSSIDFVLTIVGSGDITYETSISNLIQFSGGADIRRIPWVPREKTPEILLNHDVLVLPTIHPEPLSRVIQEAMAAGLFVVATPTGGTPEVIRDGVTGFLVEAGNAPALACILKQIYSHYKDLASIRLNASNLIRNEYSIQVMLNRFEEQIITWLDK